MADSIPNMHATGSKDLTRRTVLGELTLAGSTLTLPIPAFEGANLHSLDVEGHPHPVLALPFVRSATEGEKAVGAAPRNFWEVTPTGHYGDDCATGARYARQAVDYMVRERSPHIFQRSVFDMMSLTRRYSGIEVGFLGVFGQLAVQAMSPASGEGDAA